jgi:hypothetical protein
MRVNIALTSDSTPTTNQVRNRINNSAWIKLNYSLHIVDQHMSVNNESLSNMNNLICLLRLWNHNLQEKEQCSNHDNYCEHRELFYPEPIQPLLTYVLFIDKKRGIAIGF